MAGGEQSTKIEVDPEAQRRWDLSRRSDLTSVFGMVLDTPPHGQDNEGNWGYGLAPFGGIANQQFVNEFQAEMQDLVAAHGSTLVSEGVITPEQLSSIEGHPYSVGPAAQEWPKVFFEFYKVARPILSDGATLLTWASFFKGLIDGIRWWGSKKQKEVNDSLQAKEALSGQWVDMTPKPVLTEPALIALCYSDMVERYGIGIDVRIDVYPRSNSVYSTPDHPAGWETYLIRIKAGERSFFYLVDGKGAVSEHYLITGTDLTLLPIPQLFDEGIAHSSRQPQMSDHVEVRVTRGSSK